MYIDATQIIQVALTYCSRNLLFVNYRMEVVKLRSTYGVAKLTGVALCLAGIFIIAFYAGPSLSPVNHHHAFQSGHTSSIPAGKEAWIKGTFLKLLGDMIWSLWITLQVNYS